MKLVRHLIVAGLAGSLVQFAAAADVPAPLITPQWLKAHLSEVTVVDVREGTKGYTAQPELAKDKAGKTMVKMTGGHVPGAIAVDFDTIRHNKVVDGKTIKAQLPTAEYFTKVMDAAGLNKSDKPIVIVPTGQTVDTMDMATRLYFQLRYFGEPATKVAILNGGVNAWLLAGNAVSTDKPAASAGNWAASGEDKAILATLDEVKGAVHNGSVQFIDARPTPQFLGIVTKPVNKSGGHLPGAKSFPTDAIVRDVDGATQFMTAADYRRIFHAYDISASEPTVTYCNTGHLASGAWFVAHEILGNKKSKLYAGSMIEWTNLGNPTVGLAD